MTTQNNHSEHSDVEATVVEHLPVPETETGTTAPPPSSETAAPVTDEAAVEAPTVHEQTDIVNVEPEAGDMPSPPETVHARDIPADDTHETFPDAPAIAETSQASSHIEEGEVRPFTDFIEEFRQAEARFSASLQDYQRESAAFPAPTGAEVGAAASSTFEQAVESQTESTATITETPPAAARPVSPLLRPASPRMRMPRHGSGRQREDAVVGRSLPAETPGGGAAAHAGDDAGQFIAPKVESAGVQPDAAEEQPRPARRYRFDRPAATTQMPQVATPPVQARSEESRDVHGRSSTAVPVHPGNGHMTNGPTGEREIQQSLPNTADVAGAAVQLPEQHAPEQPVVQEAAVVEASSTAATPAVTPDQDRRRRHGQERQRVKAQTPPAAPTPTAVAAEPVTAVPEPVTPANGAKDVNPEDLPPLEYAELQKANTRRRRRRHPGSPATPTVAVAGTPLAAVTKSVVPIPADFDAPAAAITPTALVMPVPTPPVVMPRTPVPANTTAPFTITSGYTVSQMNQSQAGSGPFMGPDPSPARGSTSAQNVRSIRTDVQRTPSYPVRTTEATSASVHQLASVVSQAIQTQTDRMIAELRRANQSPTNISVSLPPFPSNERVGVFVDVANLLYSARTLRMTVDFGKLLDFLRGNRRLIRAQAYCPTSPQAGDEQMFLQAVKGLGYRITTKNYKTFSSGAKKADLDLDLCMDVVRLVDGRAVDCIVLVSGDSDFMPMLDYCSDHGVRVEVAAFDEAMSATLRQGCDLFINLSMLEEIRA